MKIVRYILWSFITLAGVSFAGCQADTDTHPEPQPVGKRSDRCASTERDGQRVQSDIGVRKKYKKQRQRNLDLRARSVDS